MAPLLRFFAFVVLLSGEPWVANRALRRQHENRSRWTGRPAKLGLLALPEALDGLGKLLLWPPVVRWSPGRSAQPTELPRRSRPHGLWKLPACLGSGRQQRPAAAGAARECRRGGCRISEPWRRPRPCRPAHKQSQGALQAQGRLEIHACSRALAPSVRLHAGLPRLEAAVPPRCAACYCRRCAAPARCCCTLPGPRQPSQQHACLASATAVLPACHTPTAAPTHCVGSPAVPPWRSSHPTALPLHGQSPPPPLLAPAQARLLARRL